MSGIYLHIPFCRKKCHYCDFFKSTGLNQKPELLTAMKKELISRKLELEGEVIETIYFGGGTPSVLSAGELAELLKSISQNYQISAIAEITLEANPDDLMPEYLAELRRIGFNRLSIGIQSFSDPNLKLMNRRHDALQATQSVGSARAAGFQNISIDLIYGIPNQTAEDWEQNIQHAINLEVQHISAYHLTYHEGTVFHDQLTKGILKELPDELSIRQFELLTEMLKTAGFEQYEISNFCIPGNYSKHNSSYWKGSKYLGIGPSAHSFDRKTRRWNVSSVEDYLSGIGNDMVYYETEILTEQDRYNDYLITGLRTIWGISEAFIKEHFNEHVFNHFQLIKAKYLKAGYLIQTEDSLVLLQEGLLISDQIVADFMLVEY
jgi:oxygen-independent coproporphyrinogen-3 oxidase